MKKILLLEDNLYTAEDMKEEIDYVLTRRGYHIDVKIANSIDEANNRLATIRDEDLICTIADLNMNPEGLTAVQRKQTKGAVLTGWVWIYSCLWKREALRTKPIIFYSAFTSQLASDSNYLDCAEKKRITLMSKLENDNNDLCEMLIKIIKRSNGINE